MSERSLPSFGHTPKPRPPASALASVAAIMRRVYARLGDTLRRVRRRGVEPPPGGPSPELESRAARLVREYLDAEAANLERAERLGEKAARLEKAGTPSESARNRAERARREVAAGLGALRARFVEGAGERAEGTEGARAFDRVVEALCPAYGPRPGRPLGDL